MFPVEAFISVPLENNPTPSAPKVILAPLSVILAVFPLYNASEYTPIESGAAETSIEDPFPNVMFTGDVADTEVPAALVSTSLASIPIEETPLPVELILPLCTISMLPFPVAGCPSVYVASPTPR